MNSIRTYKMILPMFFLAGSLFLFNGCSKEEDPEGTVDKLPGIDLENIEKDQGKIGISISSRDIARKGYKPAFADVVVSSETGDFSKSNIPVDEYTNIANLSLNNADLTEEQKQELMDGVDISIVIKDKDGNILSSTIYSKTSFTSGPEELEQNSTSLEDRYAEVSIRDDILHYIQVVKDDNSSVVGAPDNSNYSNANSHPLPIKFLGIEAVDYTDENSSIRTGYIFKGIEGKPGVFSIARYDGDDIHYMYINVSTNVLSVQTRKNLEINKKNIDPNDFINYHFKIEKADIGRYLITSLFTEKPIYLNDSKTQFISGDHEPSYFRILSLDIDWSIQTIDSRIMQPILPPSNTSSAFNSTLRNCSSGELIQTVGQAESLTSTTIAGWEESMSVSSTHSGSVSVTVGAEVETSFFGNSGSSSVSVTGSYAYSKSTTETSVRSGALGTSKTVTISTERSINVPPGKATQVSDIYQTYENIRIPYVQRFRIKGSFRENGQALTGLEILTQFAFNSFTGVVSEIGSDYIEVTVRGTNHIDRLIDTRTSADDVPADCG